MLDRSSLVFTMLQSVSEAVHLVYTMTESITSHSCLMFNFADFLSE